LDSDFANLLRAGLVLVIARRREASRLSLKVPHAWVQPVHRPNGEAAALRGAQMRMPRHMRGIRINGCLTMTYFRTGTPYYHRRAAVSRSCSGWEGVGPAGYGRQALIVQLSAVRYRLSATPRPLGHAVADS
jgi:hypothetical protein